MHTHDEHIKLVERLIEQKRQGAEDEGRELTPDEKSTIRAGKEYLKMLRNPPKPPQIPTPTDVELVEKFVRRIFPRAVFEADSQTGEIIIYTGYDKEGKQIGTAL